MSALYVNIGWPERRLVFGELTDANRPALSHSVHWIVQTNHEEPASAHAPPQAHRKPGYLEICCNLATLCHPSLVHPSPPLPLPARPRAPGALEAALGAAAAALRGAASPLILVGPRVLRAGAGAASALIKVVEASGLPVVVTADARSAIPEDHEQMVGTYWCAAGAGE